MFFRVNILFCALILFGCFSKNQNVASDEKGISTNDSSKIQGEPDELNTKGHFELDSLSIDSIKIVYRNNPVLDDSTFENKDDCLKWKLTESDIRKILKMSKRISGSDMHHLYYDLPCRIKGELILNGISYRFIINAGSFIYLSNAEDKFYLGCSDEKCKKYFLIQGGDPNRDVIDHQ